MTVELCETVFTLHNVYPEHFSYYFKDSEYSTVSITKTEVIDLVSNIDNSLLSDKVGNIYNIHKDKLVDFVNRHRDDVRFIVHRGQEDIILEAIGLDLLEDSNYPGSDIRLFDIDVELFEDQFAIMKYKTRPLRKDMVLSCLRSKELDRQTGALVNYVIPACNDVREKILSDRHNVGKMTYFIESRSEYSRYVLYRGDGYVLLHSFLIYPFL